MEKDTLNLNARGVEDSSHGLSVVLGPGNVERSVDDELLPWVRVPAVGLLAVRLQVIDDVCSNGEVALLGGVEEVVDLFRVQGVQLQMIVNIVGSLEVDESWKRGDVEVGSNLEDDQEELGALLVEFHPLLTRNPAPTQVSVVVVGFQGRQKTVSLCHVSGLDEDHVGRSSVLPANFNLGSNFKKEADTILGQILVELKADLGDVADRPNSVVNVRDLAAQRLLHVQLLEEIFAAADQLRNLFVLACFSEEMFGRFLVQRKSRILLNDSVNSLVGVGHGQDVLRRQQEQNQLHHLRWKPIKTRSRIFCGPSNLFIFGLPNLFLPPSQVFTPRHSFKIDVERPKKGLKSVDSVLGRRSQCLNSC